MAFHLYSKSDQRYTRVNGLKLTGKGGLLAQYLQAHAAEDTPYTWQIVSRNCFLWSTRISMLRTTSWSLICYPRP